MENILLLVNLYLNCHVSVECNILFAYYFYFLYLLLIYLAASALSCSTCDLCFISFLLKDNCFTVLCWLLPYTNMNQP